MIFNILLSAYIALAMDYYSILEVSPDATNDEISKSFRVLSKKYHPDKNKGNQEAHQMYLDLTRANDVLKDPHKRQIYDLYGEEGLQDQSRMNLKTGPSYKFDLEVDLEDVYVGKIRETSIRRNEICPKCKGTGAKDRKTMKCSHCDGKGVRMQRVNNFGFNMQMQVNCDKCSGRGYIAQERCKNCGGRRIVNELATFKVQIEAGMTNGAQIPFQGQSERNPDWFPGDIFFVVKVKTHPRFERKSNDLYTKVRLTLREALLGYQKQIAHLDGHIVSIEYSGVTQPGSFKKVKGEGMPVHEFPSQTGDLYVEFLVDLPKVISSEHQAIISNTF